MGCAQICILKTSMTKARGANQNGARGKAGRPLRKTVAIVKGMMMAAWIRVVAVERSGKIQQGACKIR